MFNIQYSHSILVFNSHSILTLIVIFNTPTFNSHSILTFNTGSGIQQYSILTFQQSFNTHIQQWYSTATEDLQPRLSLTKTVHVFTLSIVLVLTQFNTKFIENLLHWCVVFDTGDLHSQGSLTRPKTVLFQTCSLPFFSGFRPRGARRNPCPFFQKLQSLCNF